MRSLESLINKKYIFVNILSNSSIVRFFMSMFALENNIKCFCKVRGVPKYSKLNSIETNNYSKSWVGFYGNSKEEVEMDVFYFTLQEKLDADTRLEFYEIDYETNIIRKV